MGVPQNGWFMLGKVPLDDLGALLFQETSICDYTMVYPQNGLLVGRIMMSQWMECIHIGC